ncbi:YgfZ/GcvT domain-containing protein [Parahaliea aestuarii]|uniref:Folate-binding protein YgfZ n=1 Tax=Parahaliea aestuarii TaxID=1852021 RepID=A0A5C8ZUJ9_9GAMM|nr:folate-binding protein YgfZ [Parahaliea aestuarii]TXS91444.1 folate-binding protein YgfZ [Parahaliea aestuarii]
MPPFYSPLHHESLLRVSGPDAATFLQGQTTCDVRQVDSHNARPGAWCNVQGRILADFLLTLDAAGHYLLRLRADIIEGTAERLKKYVVFSKASIDAAPDWQVIGCWGEGVKAALQALLPEVPGARHGSCAGEGYQLLQVDDAGQRYELFLSSERKDLLEALPAHLQAAEPGQWRALEIAAGIGRVEAATVEAFLPQMLNYDLTGFVNFQKGCYTGQEVIARLHYRGTAKRRLFLARVDAAEIPTAGTGLYTEGANQAAGNVVNAVATGEQSCALLVCASLSAAQAPLCLGNADGPRLQLQAPDYLEEALSEAGQDGQQGNTAKP